MKGKFLHLCFIAFASMSAIKVSAQCAVTSTPANTSGCTFGDQIDSFHCSGITAISPATFPSCSTGPGGYGSYTTPHWTFTPGSTYTYTAHCGGGTWSEAFAIWIDLNNNGTYEATEMVASNAPSSATVTGSFTIPTTAIGGTNIHMRLRDRYATAITGTMCATVFSYGETEDYFCDVVCLSVPTITLGSNPTVPIGTTSATIPYSGVTGSPTNYSIVWSAPATAVGFTNVTGAALPASPFTIPIPGTATPGTYTGYLTVIGSACPSAVDTFSITILPLFMSMPTDTSNVCVGVTTAKLAYTMAAGSPTTFSIIWDAATLAAGFSNVTGAAFTPSPLTLPVPAAPPTPATYSGTLTLSNGATTSLPYSVYVTMNVHYAPTISISGPASQTPGYPVTLHATVGTAGPNYTIEWYNHGSQFNISSNSPAITYTKAGYNDTIYSRIVSHTQYCSDSSIGNIIIVVDPTIVEPSNVNTVQGSNGISAHPVPFNNNIVITGLKQGDNVSIYDMAGRNVTPIWSIETEQPQHTFATNSLASGSYILKVTDVNGKKKENIPLVKQ